VVSTERYVKLEEDTSAATIRLVGPLDEQLGRDLAVAFDRCLKRRVSSLHIDATGAVGLEPRRDNVAWGLLKTLVKQAAQAGVSATVLVGSERRP
jgi:hypothetical protein